MSRLAVRRRSGSTPPRTVPSSLIGRIGTRERPSSDRPGTARNSCRLCRRRRLFRFRPEAAVPGAVWRWPGGRKVWQGSELAIGSSIGVSNMIKETVQTEEHPKCKYSSNDGYFLRWHRDFEPRKLPRCAETVSFSLSDFHSSRKCS